MCLYIAMCVDRCVVCTDRDNFRQLISDVVARPRTEKGDDVTDAAKNINDLIDAALALNLPEETIIADLLTLFIGGFHTSASRECSSTLM